MLPNFIGIGANRAGSTWLHRNLAEHPDVYLPWQKELHYFDLDENWERGSDWYAEYFDDSDGENAVGEITPKYLHHEPAAARIHQLLPEARIICCLRNPVDRAYSQHWRSEAMSETGQQTSFEEKLEQHPDIVRTGMYYDHLLRYYELFPSDQIHVYLFDDMEQRPNAVMEEVYSFLGVDPSFESSYLSHKINSGAALGSLSRSKMLSYLRRAAKKLGPSASGLEKKLENANSRDLPPMRPETEAYLKNLYREQIESLQVLLDRDLAMWLEEPTAELRPG